MSASGGEQALPVVEGPTCVGAFVGDVGTNEPFGQRFVVGGTITRFAAAVAAALADLADTQGCIFAETQIAGEAGQSDSCLGWGALI